MSNPAPAWAMLTARSKGSGPPMPPGVVRLTPEEVAAMLVGLGRGPYLTALAHYTGDLHVVRDLDIWLTTRTHAIHVEQNWGEVERGGEISRRLSATAIYGLLQPTHCEVCNGKGESHQRIRCMEVHTRPRVPKPPPVAQRPRNWSPGVYLPERTRSHLVHWRRLRKFVAARRAKDELVHVTGSRVWYSGKCRWCCGSGKSHMSDRIRANLAGLSLGTWQRHWARRYPDVLRELHDWRDIAWAHLARQLDRNREDAA